MIRPRWLTPRFSLRTLFVLVTLFAIFFGWQMQWMQKRHGYAKLHPSFDVITEPPPGEAAPDAPSLLWIWGEHGIWKVSVQSPGFGSTEKKEYHRKHPCTEAIEARKLFPEAIIEITEDGILWNTWFPGKEWSWY